ncbi:MAG TPA: hypothetical protein VHP11_08150 [Tepidisphaeraceae bacterium]|nr:hypothetical protein [Tepidisphaeraceae bacterium]
MPSLQEINGFRELSSPLTQAMLAPLPTQVHRLQMRSPLADDECRQVAALLEEYPQVGLRAYGSFRSPFTDLEFLRFFPRLRHVWIDLYELQNFDGLRHLASELETLGLGQFKTKRFSLRAINRFCRLQTLSVNGPAKDIEVISSLTTLRTLGLLSFRLADLAFLQPLPELKSLSIALGSLADCSHLPRLSKLADLAIRRVRGVQDVAWLSAMMTLEDLWLQDLPYVQHLPDLTGLKKLRIVVLEGLKGLTDVNGLMHAQPLRQLDLLNLPTLAPESLACFRDHPVCASIRVGLCTDDRNRRAFAALGRLDEWAPVTSARRT